MKKTVMNIITLLVLAGCYEPVFARNPWLTATTINGQTRPVSAGIDVPHFESVFDEEVSTRNAGTSEVTDSKRYFDFVISYHGYPDGDNDGNRQAENSAEWSTQDKIEKIIQYCADGVYEATEGMHLLRNITIFKGGKRSDHCDILWKNKIDGPPATLNMINSQTGGDIRIADVVQGNINLLNQVEAAGYVLTHEMGHYLYGLFDEYRLADKIKKCIPVKFSIMNNPDVTAIGRNYKALNFSVKWRKGTPGYFGDWEDTTLTEQHRLHRKSCWETLALNPKEKSWKTLGIEIDTDPAKAMWENNGVRPFYPELKAVAPKGNNLPRIDLSPLTPEKDLPSRAALNIIWEPGTVVMLTIDRSGSMSGAPLAYAKAAAKSILDMLEDGTEVGVIAFDHTVSTVLPIMTLRTNDTSIATIKAAIDGIAAGGATAIGDAARTALNTLLNHGISNNTAVVYLLTDGVSNEGEDPLDVIPDYQQNKVALVGFGYGNYADDRMDEMTYETGGGYFSNLYSLMDVHAAFCESAGMVADLVVCLSGETGSTLDTAITVPVNVPFAVDASMTKLWVSAAWEGSPSSVNLWLTRPNGTTVAPSSVTTIGSTVSAQFVVNNPAPGMWALSGTRPANVNVAYFANAATAGMEGFSLYVEAMEYDRDTGKLLAVASMRGQNAIDGAAVTGRLILSNGIGQTQVFTNALPGIYMAEFPGAATPPNNRWKLTVRAENPGSAVFTWRGAQIGRLEDGTVPEIEDAPVGVVFSRVATARVRYPKSVLTVKGGTGSGRYTPGTVVPISAPNPYHLLMTFNGWTGDTKAAADASSPSTTVTVTDTTTLTATWRPVLTPNTYLIFDLLWNDMYYADAPPSSGWSFPDRINKIIMRKVNPGTFMMGDSVYPNAPAHEVTLTDPFYLGAFPVNQWQWHRVTGKWPSANSAAPIYDILPVENVSYHDVRGASSDWPSVQTVEPNSFMGLLRTQTGGKFAFDLPTEAQWEYACRAGSTTAFFFGDGDSALGTYAWTSLNGPVATQYIGLKPANPWGFHDILGNVSEMCLDWYDGASGLTATNPTGAVSSPSGTRVARGGSIHSATSEAFRSGYRNATFLPDTRSPSMGLRLALTMQEASLTVNGGAVNTGGVYVVGRNIVIAPEDPGDGSEFLYWEVSPPGTNLGTGFHANDPYTVITLPAGGVTLTQIRSASDGPDVTYLPAPIITQAPALGGGGITLTWAPPDTLDTVVGYILEAKENLDEEYWDRPEGEELLPPTPCTYTLPAGTSFRFFRVTAVIERLNVED